ncbi:MAG: DNA gyrase inhibitor YacG [Planctomycetia bacterium]|nr:DNA gyrase inhibitor YacG [Planctomycetia bacterium]
MCGKMFDSEASNAMPFCSKRCRLADLNGWFSEERSIPVDIERELERQAENLVENGDSETSDGSYGN